jgi:hypothetical protein
MENPFFHNSKYNLYIDKSQIQNSGFGVYTNDFIENNTLIDEYVGDIVNIGGPYVVSLNDEIGIDAFNLPRCYMAMLNDASFVPIRKIKKNRKNVILPREENKDKNNNILTNNCEFVFNGNRCFIYALRDIQKNEELFISYGNLYWKNY